MREIDSFFNKKVTEIQMILSIFMLSFGVAFIAVYINANYFGGIIANDYFATLYSLLGGVVLTICGLVTQLKRFDKKKEDK